MILRLKQSFENKKDADLPAKLEAELEAIAAWGMIGLARLYKNKSFTASADGQELAQTMKSFSEPIKEFISDCCSVGSDYSVTIDEMYKKFVEWSNESGRKPSDKQRLSRALATAAGVVTRRPGKGNRRQRMYFGIKLRSIYEYDTSEDGSASASSVDASASSVDANNPRNDGEIESRPLASASTSTNYYMENEKEGERESSDGEIPVSLNRENSGRKRTADAIADAMKNAEENEQIAFVPPDRVPYFNQSFKHKLLPKSYGESFVIDGVKYYRLNISSYYWYEYNANRINIGSHPSPLDAIKLDAAIRTAMPFFWYWMDRNLEDGQKRALAALREAGAIPTLLEQCGG